MDILDSAWLINMLKKSGTTPEARMLSLFDILADWVEAPQIRESFNYTITSDHLPSNLLAYLTEQARANHAQLPEILAQQLCYMAIGALRESLNSSATNHLAHAKFAAKALIHAQKDELVGIGTAPQAVANFTFNKPSIYGIAASLAGMLMVGGILFLNHSNSLDSTAIAQSNALKNQFQTDVSTTQVASPQAAADMLLVMEQMRHGDCRFPEALQIPDAHKKVYIENVVGGQPPKSRQDQAIANFYLAKVSCNYTPMLMKNSIN